MLDLIEILDQHASDLARSLGELPDPHALLRRLRSILRGDPSTEPWFPQVPMEHFLRGTAVIEEYMLGCMGWEVEPDPVVRARARSRLRRGLARLARQYAAAMDREQATLRSRLEATRRRIEDQQRLLETLLKYIPTAVFLLDAEGAILESSESTARITGLAPAHTTGQNITAVVPNLPATLADRVRNAQTAPGPLEVEEAHCTILLPDSRDEATLNFGLARLPGPPEPGGTTWVLFCTITEARGGTRDRG